MKSKMRPYKRSVSSSPWWFFLGAALVVYSGLTFFSYHLSSMENPPVWGLWVTSFSELIGLAILFPIALFFRASKNDIERLARQEAITALNAIPKHDFAKKLAETFQRMGYTVLFPDVTARPLVYSFKIIHNSQVTFVFFDRSSSTRLETARFFLENMFTEGAERGMFVTTGLFSKAALKHFMSEPVLLIDGITLLSIFSKHRSTCVEKNTFSDTFDSFPSQVKADPFLKETSPLCPACGSDMRIILAGTLKKQCPTYWECAQKPECGMTLDYELCPL